MTRILVNKCRDIIQKKKQFCLMEEVPEVPSQDKGYEDTEWKEALNMLGERYRLIMMLYYVEGFQINEISSILKSPRARSGPVWPGKGKTGRGLPPGTKEEQI